MDRRWGGDEGAPTVRGHCSLCGELSSDIRSSRLMEPQSPSEQVSGAPRTEAFGSTHTPLSIFVMGAFSFYNVTLNSKEQRSTISIGHLLLVPRKMTEDVEFRFSNRGISNVD